MDSWILRYFVEGKKHLQVQIVALVGAYLKYQATVAACPLQWTVLDSLRYHCLLLTCLM